MLNVHTHTHTHTLTCLAVPVEHVNIHEVLQVFSQRLSSQPGELVGTLDALGLPVCPVQLVLVHSQAEGVRQLSANQNLYATTTEEEGRLR